jgi:hypothetical protein
MRNGIPGWGGNAGIREDYQKKIRQVSPIVCGQGEKVFFLLYCSAGKV